MRHAHTPIRRLRNFTLACAGLLLAACGASDDPSPVSPSAGQPTPPVDSQPASRAQATAATPSVDYAAVAMVSLAAVGLPETVTLSQISVSSGSASALTVQGGEIRFLTPSDPGSDATTALTVALTDSDVIVPVVLRSARPTEVVTEIEPTDAGTLPATATGAKLIVKGLGAGNAFTGGALSFTVNGAPPFDVKASSATVFVPETGATFDLAKDWTLDAASNTLTVTADKVAALLAVLPSGELQIDVGLTSADGEFAVAWTFLAYKPTATLHGRVVGVEGALQPSAAGKSVAIRGIDNLTRIVSLVDATGAFNAGPLGAGTYELSILDTQAPGFWTATVPIFQGSTTVNADLVYAPTATATAASSSKEQAQALHIRSTVTQNGHGPAARPSSGAPREKALSATPSTCETAGTQAGESTYRAVAAAQNSTIGCVVAHTVPAGTTHVSIDLSVFTEEYPDYTTVKSQYNDTWAYAIAGLAGVPSASGSVNDTHYTQGTISKTYCVDVTAAAKNGPLTFNANLSATNIGDSILPTTVTMAVTLTCPKALKVTKATFTSPNAKGYAVIKPIAGNLDGHYISLPVVTSVDDWGIPLAVSYEPKEAVITKVRIGVIVDGAPVMSASDLSSAITSRSDGKLVFANLVIPRIPSANFAGKTSVVIELTGTVASDVLTSKPEEGGIQFDGGTSFVPLFLAGDLLGAARRYGQGTIEPGQDSWSTFNTVAWLQSKPYRFNDVTALHAAQTATGRSVLDHTGHSDGTQIDMRYADGSGGFTDALGGQEDGAFIKTMLSDAAAEVAAGGVGVKPNLVKSIAWISANRSMIEGESAGARKMHAGPSWMKLALFDGKFPNGTPIPGIASDGTLIAGMGSWTNKPANLSFVAPHLHHWHISLSGI